MTGIDLLVTSGDGPAECRIAVLAMIDILRREAERLGCGVEVSLAPAPDRHGPKSALVSLGGDAAAAIARDYTGTIKFLFKSPVRPGHKRQNWFVAVRPVDLSSEEKASALDPADLRFETLRAGGPGGQHQNTTDSAVRVVHVPTGLSAMARDERSQHRNKALAVRRLQGLLHALQHGKAESAKRERFLAHHAIERGNAVKTFRL
jgi:peptide chain release factor